MLIHSTYESDTCDSRANQIVEYHRFYKFLVAKGNMI